MIAKIFDLTGKRIYVAGHRGMVGSAIVRRLVAYGCDVITASRAEVDLERQEQAETVFAGDQARRGGRCRRQGRRHSCQQRLSCRIHCQKSGDRAQYHSVGATRPA